MQHKYVTEIIGKDYQRWKLGEKIIIDCGTGSGKTFFCLHVLCKYAASIKKKVLFLCNRKKLKEVVRDHWADTSEGMDNWVSIITYQKLQVMLQKHEEVDEYDYVIVDECHYFTADSFNNNTDRAYHYLSNLKNSTVVFMSATAAKFFSFLRKNGIVSEDHYYYLPRNYEHVTELHFYQKDDLVTILTEMLNKDDNSKAVVFCNSAARMVEMYVNFGKTAEYTCSESSREASLRKICNFHAINDDQFKSRILFSTSVLDNGIDLKDPDLKFIFSEIVDVDVMVQTLGRKRPINDDDKCEYYIRDYCDKRELNGFIRNNSARLKPAREYKNDRKGFKQHYKNDHRELFDSDIRNNPIFNFDNGKISINEMIFNKYVLDEEFFCDVRESTYKEAVLKRLDTSLSSKLTDHELHEPQMGYPKFLEPYENVYLYKEERQEIIELFNAAGIKKKCSGVETFNGVLNDDFPDYPFRFVSKNKNGDYLRDKRRRLDNGEVNPDRNKLYWFLTDIA